MAVFEAGSNVRGQEAEKSKVLCILSLVSFCVLNFFSSYTKPKGQLPDYDSPVVLHSEKLSVEDFCNKLHRTIAKEFK